MQTCFQPEMVFSNNVKGLFVSFGLTSLVLFSVYNIAPEFHTRGSTVATHEAESFQEGIAQDTQVEHQVVPDKELGSFFDGYPTKVPEVALGNNHLQNATTAPMPKGNVTLVIGTDWTFMPIFLNSILSLRTFGAYRFVSQCYDDVSCEYLKKAGFQIYEDKISQGIANLFYSTSNCMDKSEIGKMRAMVMYMRLDLYKSILGKRDNILMVDADTCWLKPPESIFVDQEYDMVFAAHIGGVNLPGFSFPLIDGHPTHVRINPGLAFIRPTDFIISTFFPKVYSDSLNHMCDPGFAQGAVSRQLYDDGNGLKMDYNMQKLYLSGSMPGATVRTIPFTSYRHGCVTDDIPPAPREIASVIHPNCHNDIRSKIKFMRDNECWYLRADWESFDPSMGTSKFLDSIDIRTNPMR